MCLSKVVSSRDKVTNPVVSLYRVTVVEYGGVNRVIIEYFFLEAAMTSFSQFLKVSDKPSAPSVKSLVIASRALRSRPSVANSLLTYWAYGWLGISITTELRTTTDDAAMAFRLLLKNPKVWQAVRRDLDNRLVRQLVIDLSRRECQMFRDVVVVDEHSAERSGGRYLAREHFHKIKCQGRSFEGTCYAYADRTGEQAAITGNMK